MQTSRSYLNVSLTINQQILGFQVPINQVKVVKVLENQHYLGSIKPWMRLAVKMSYKVLISHNIIHGRRKHDRSSGNLRKWAFFHIKHDGRRKE